ncbi:MAG: hypothetical protein JSW08_00020 [archaeon]|nr:MAG: hypothetical protein JSW08_00020 [archaeon]
MKEKKSSFFLFVLVLTLSFSFISAWNFEQGGVTISTWSGNLTNVSQMQDVDTDGATDGQAFVWNATTGHWEAETISGITDTFEANYSDYLIIRAYALNDSFWTLNYSTFLDVASWNDTGLIQDWNSSGLIANWSLVIGSLEETLWNANYSDYLIIRSYALNDSLWSSNFSDYLIIRNYALNDSLWTGNYSNFSTIYAYAINDTDFNASGLIIDWNASSLIANWTLVIGESITWAEVVNGTMMLASDWNSTNISYDNVFTNWTTYNTTWSSGITWAEVINGTMMPYSAWNSTNISYDNTYTNFTTYNTTWATDTQVTTNCSEGNFIEGIYGSDVYCDSPAGSGDITMVYPNDTYILSNNTASGDVYLWFNTSKTSDFITWAIATNGTLMPQSNWNATNTSYVTYTNLSNSNVNRSDHWDDYDSVNATHFEDVGGVMTIVLSWFSDQFDVYFGAKDTDDLTEGSSNLYDNQSWNQTRTYGNLTLTSGNLTADYVFGNGSQLTDLPSGGNPFDQDLNTTDNVKFANFNVSESFTSVGFGSMDGNNVMNIVSLGSYAGYDNLGSKSVLIGEEAGFENEGNNSIFLGYNSGEANTGNNCVGIGYQAGKSNSLDNQFILKQTNVNAMPLIQGNFSSGYVGINTTTPQNFLNVVGDANITGLIYGNGSQLTNVPVDWSGVDNGTFRYESWDNFTGIPHATPSDGDTTHFSLADEIYDWVVGLAYVTWANVVNGTMATWSQAMNGTLLQTAQQTNLTEDDVEAYIFDTDNTANLQMEQYNVTNLSYSTFCNGANCWKMYVNSSDWFIIEEI